MRKNFNFNTDLIEKAEMRAAQSKRSLTKHIEKLIQDDLDNNEREFFSYLKKYHNPNAKSSLQRKSRSLR